MDLKTAWAQEWTTLQNNFERYEHGVMWLKLASVVVFLTGAMLLIEPLLLAVLLLVLWVQEAIYKTFQNRLGARLQQLESRIAAPPGADAGEPFQLHSGWLAQRKGLKGLLAEYAASALRPTVAFPHVLLLLALLMLVTNPG